MTNFKRRHHIMLSLTLAFFLVASVSSFQSSQFTVTPRTVRLPNNALSISAPVDDYPSSTIEDKSSSPSRNEAIDGDQFDWYSSWYPLVPVEYLDPSKPHKFTLLGIDLVVWNDAAQTDKFEPKSKSKEKKGLRNLFRRRSNETKNENVGQWKVFVDKCPHRLVPLSEGRVESDGSLLCSYHGWRFNGEGECIGLPQSTENEFNKVKSNPRSQCNSFPVKIVNDVLWVWPDSGPDAKLQSALTPLSVMPLLDDNGNPIPEENVIYNNYNFRELPYGADYFLENVVDPAHVPVSHHNVVGNRYTDPKPIIMKTAEPMTKHGFVLTHGDQIKTRHEFKSPCLVSIDSKVTEAGARQILELYCSPSRPGFCNHVGRLVMIKDNQGNVPSGFKMFTLPIPVWINHVLAASFLNQDALFLHAQERNLHRDLDYKSSSSINDKDSVDKNPSYKKMVYTPTISDKGVLMFRDWLRLKAGGRIPFQGYQGMPPVDNEVVFDQWHSHTSKCKYCMGAYKNARKVRVATATLAILLAICRPRGVITTAAAVGLFGGISYSSHKVMKSLRRFEFSHAEND